MFRQTTIRCLTVWYPPVNKTMDVDFNPFQMINFRIGELSHGLSTSIWRFPKIGLPLNHLF